MNWKKHRAHNRIMSKAIQWILLVAAGALVVLGLRLLPQYIHFASDWEIYFQPITLGWLKDSLTLYTDTQWGWGFWNPPWLLWPLVPLAVWPTWLGWGLLVVGTLLLMAWQTQGFRRRWLVFASPLIIDLVLDGPVEIVPMLGIALGWLGKDRPLLLGIALVLLAAKPQACFLVALWLLVHHRHRLRSLVVPAMVLAMSLLVHGWDWPLRWASGPSVFSLINSDHNVSPWRSVGWWMAPVALVLAIWVICLPLRRRNLGAVVAANALVTPFVGSYSLVHVLTFSLLPLGPTWALLGWVASFTPLLRPFFGQEAVRVDFAIAAVLMVGYLLQAYRHSRSTPGQEVQP